MVTKPLALHPLPGHTTPLDTARFETLSVGLDDQFARMSDVWDASVFKTSSEELKEPSRLKRDGDAVFLERVQARILPFAARTVDRGLWHIATNGILTPTMGEVKVRVLLGPCALPCASSPADRGLRVLTAL